MRFCIMLVVLLSLVIVNTVSVVAAGDISPVLIWKEKIRFNSSIIVMSQTEFGTLITPYLQDYMMVAFAEAQLTTNDFKCMNNKTHKPCFLHMRQIPSYTYIPRVYRPLEVFNSLTDASFSHFPDANEQYDDLFCEPSTVHTIYLPEVQNISRVDEIEMHDRFIMSVSKNTSCKVLFFFMAGSQPTPNMPISQRSRIQSTTEGTLLRTDFFNIYFTGIFLRDRSNGLTKAMNVTEIKASHPLNSNKLEVSLNTSTHGDITFEVESAGGYYSIKRFVLKSSTFSVRDIDAPYSFSYYCAEVRVHDGHGSTLIFENLQFELHSNVLKKSRAFSRPWNCTGFMSAGIISGLLVVMLLLGILSFGLCWIIDVHMCDRFENPKGKALVIVAKD